MVALCLCSFTQLGHHHIPYLFLALTGAATVYYYNHSYLLESNDNAPNQRNIWVREHAGQIKKIQWLLLTFIIGGGCYQLYTLLPGLALLERYDILYCCLIGLGAFLYYFDTKKYPWLNLRSYGIAKPLVIGSIWAGVGVYAPYLFLKLTNQAYDGMAHMPILFISNALYISIIALLFDIKDFESDANKQMKTLVVRMGLTKTITDVLVAIFERPTHIHRIIGVDELDSLNTGYLNQEIESLFHSTLFGDVMAGGKDVAGIEADANLWVIFERFEIVL